LNDLKKTVSREKYHNLQAGAKDLAQEIEKKYIAVNAAIVESNLEDTTTELSSVAAVDEIEDKETSAKPSKAILGNNVLAIGCLGVAACGFAFVAWYFLNSKNISAQTTFNSPLPTTPRP